MKELYLVVGGQVKNLRTVDFQDLGALDVVGFYADYPTAEKAWRGAAQRTIDDAEIRYVIFHLHRLLNPEG